MTKILINQSKILYTHIDIFSLRKDKYRIYKIILVYALENMQGNMKYTNDNFPQMGKWWCSWWFLNVALCFLLYVLNFQNTYYFINQKELLCLLTIHALILRLTLTTDPKTTSLYEHKRPHCPGSFAEWKCDEIPVSVSTDAVPLPSRQCQYKPLWSILFSLCVIVDESSNFHYIEPMFSESWLGESHSRIDLLWMINCLIGAIMHFFVYLLQHPVLH